MYTSTEKEREKKTEITNLTKTTVTKETNKIMTRVLIIRRRFVTFRLFLFNDTSFLCFLFLFISHYDTVSIFGFFYYFFTKRCRFLQLLFCFLFSILTRVNLCAQRERERERERDRWVWYKQ